MTAKEKVLQKYPEAIVFEHGPGPFDTLSGLSISMPMYDSISGLKTRSYFHISKRLILFSGEEARKLAEVKAWEEAADLL